MCRGGTPAILLPLGPTSPASDASAKLDELQAKVVRWWVRRKDALMTMARNVVEESFAKKYGDAERTPPLQACTG